MSSHSEFVIRISDLFLRCPSRATSGAYGALNVQSEVAAADCL